KRVGLVRGVDTPVVDSSQHAAMKHCLANLSMPGITGIFTEDSTLSAGAMPLKRDNWPLFEGGSDRGRRSYGGFRKLLRNAEHGLAAIHLGPDILGTDAGGGPQHRQVIKQVRAFSDHRLRVAVDGIDHDFDGFFGQYLGHPVRTMLKKPRRARYARIEILSREHRHIEPVERITHID